MLEQLDKKTIKKNWGLIKYAIQQSIPPRIDASRPHNYTYILDALLEYRLQAWAFTNDKGKIVLFVVTEIQEDTCTNTRSLLIFSLHSMFVPSKEDWIVGVDMLKEVAKGLGCSKITAYTDIASIVQFVERNNGIVRTYIEMEV